LSNLIQVGPALDGSDNLQRSLVKSVWDSRMNKRQQYWVLQYLWAEVLNTQRLHVGHTASVQFIAQQF